MGKMINLEGQKFGRLTVLSENGRTSKGAVIWLCECECGRMINVRGDNLRSGDVKSCGCLRREKMIEGLKVRHPNGFEMHGMSRTRLCRIWQGMRRRCNNPKDDRCRYYGGRGITVCHEWDSFLNFYEWSIAHGYNDSLTIDRIDVDGNYEPNNCRWATWAEQQKNKRTTKREF